MACSINRDTSLCDLCIYVVTFGQSFTYFSLYAQHAIQILNWLGLQSVIYESQFVKINWAWFKVGGLQYHYFPELKLSLTLQNVHPFYYRRRNFTLFHQVFFWKKTNRMERILLQLWGSVYFYFACFQKSQKNTSDHVVKGPLWQSVFFKLTLMGRKMQVRFFWRWFWNSFTRYF